MCPIITILGAASIRERHIFKEMQFIIIVAMNESVKWLLFWYLITTVMQCVLVSVTVQMSTSMMCMYHCTIRSLQDD